MVNRLKERYSYYKMTTLAANITKSLLATMPAEAATRFDGVEEDEFKTFLKEYLAGQFATRAKRTGPKGKDGKGRKSGYILFANEMRPQVRTDMPDATFQQVGKELGARWQALGEKEQGVWKAKAAAMNEENGLPTPASTPSTDTVRTVRDKDSNRWLVDGTRYVVTSARSKTVVGKLRNDGKVAKLNATDLKRCEEMGLSQKA